MGRVILTAIKSGSGKTTITCGLLKELKHRGYAVKSYKCGPDYIDPMFHKRVLGIPSENLDLFFSDAEYISSIINKEKDIQISVIEGAMGIYDGILGRRKEGSVYDLAVKTNTPVVLIVDAQGMGNTITSVIKGIKADDDNGLIKGVILNRISENFYKTISKDIEAETGIRVLGYVGKISGVSIDSRHLGLKLPNEIKELDSQLETVREEISKTVDVEDVISIADMAADTVEDIVEKSDADTSDATIKETKVANRPRLAVAYDEAFCFYYEDNLRVLKEAGAEIVYFSPIHDKELPENISGLLIGGGYPELKLSELEENESMRHSIKAAINNGIPSLAECGGFMYLHEAINTEDRNYNMVGVIPGNCFNTGKLCRFGYVNLAVSKYDIKGHEFHYYDSTCNGEAGMATKPGNGKSYPFGYYEKGRLWGFPHLYYGSCKNFIIDFVEAMKEYQENNLNG